VSLNVETDDSVESTLIVRDALERSHGMERERTLHTPHPEPVQRAINVESNTEGVPLNARKIINAARALGWRTWLTHAIGYGFDTKTGGVKTVAIKEPTGETTPTGRPAMKEVAHVQAPPVNSYRAIIQAPDRILVGHWIPEFDGGLVLAGHVVLGNCDWRGLWKEFENAQSRAHLRGETPDGQLPLEGDDGKPV